MSKKVLSKAKRKTVPGYDFVKKIGDIEEYTLKSNGLGILFLERPNTGVITTNITYFVGARNEARGETGIAHMLEHMMFKPTAYDNQHRIKDGSAMHLERSTGSILNANTWKDRTTYYFSYPKPYLDESLRIEADRMTNVILNDKVLEPEQGNVLSEFDMYNGDPHFALEVEIRSTAFFSHPYGHETLGYREDIEDFTPEKLTRFYRNYYRPDNAMMMVVGDITREEALRKVKEHFGTINNPPTPIPRYAIREKRQEGTRRVTVERPSTLNIVSFGFKHPGFPKKEWFTTHIMVEVLANGPESILHKLLVDTGKAASVAGGIEPTSEESLGSISITLASGQEHQTIESITLETIHSLKAKDIIALVKKSKAHMITDELFGRTESLHIVGELTEYASARDLDSYTKTIDILDSISSNDVLEYIQQLFANSNLTIGYFKGTK